MFNSARTLITGLVSAVAFSPAVSAQSLDPFVDPVSAEILPGWVLPDGRRMVGLRLELLPGWKTYWRAPGEGGIPPEFNWRRARNVADIDISWPTPTVYVQNGMRSIGYSNVVVIPMTVTPKSASQPVRVRGDMALGVCADVCMPHSLSFDATVGHEDTRPTAAIAAALADAPYSADEAGVRASVCEITPVSNGLSVTAHVDLPHTGGREVAVIEAGQPGVWVSEASAKRQGNRLTAQAEMMHENGSAFALDRSEVRITVLGAEYAVDIQGCSRG